MLILIVQHNSFNQSHRENQLLFSEDRYALQIIISGALGWNEILLIFESRLCSRDWKNAKENSFFHPIGSETIICIKLELLGLRTKNGPYAHQSTLLTFFLRGLSEKSYILEKASKSQKSKSEDKASLLDSDDCDSYLTYSVNESEASRAISNRYAFQIVEQPLEINPESPTTTSEEKQKETIGKKWQNSNMKSLLR